MKFTEHLASHITPEWRKQYINYEEMKAMLYAAVEQAPSAEVVEPEVLTRYFTKFDEQFFHYCDRELAKINTFYSEKLAEATRRYATLTSELSEVRDDEFRGKAERSMRSSNPLRKRNISTRKIQELKLAFSEFYLSLVLLQNYQNLNFTGFRKILKKHDKLLTSDFGTKWREENVENSHFYTNKDIGRIIRETESTVTQDLEGGDRQRAMKRLRVPPLGEEQSPWTTFKVGLFSGAFVVLIVAVALSAISHRDREDWGVVCPLYRGPFLLVLLMFFWGINVYGWRSVGVNHVLIFELDPRNHLAAQHIIEMAAIFGVTWSISVLCFLYSPALGIPQFMNPFILYMLMIAFLVNPTKTFRHEARFWALRILGRIFLAPLFHVEFADFWVADQMSSLVTAFLDFQYFICFYVTNHNWYVFEDENLCMEKLYILRPVVACLPSWFRLAQCLRRYRDTKEAFPHLANAFKYGTSFFVVLFSCLNIRYEADNPWFYMWVTASVVSSCYSYSWDIKLDWGLFDPKAGDNKFLREEIVYSQTWYYYFGIVEDLVLRFGWAISLSVSEMGFLHSDVLVSILAPLEVFRRFVWNFFRLENEHLNNCGKFRAVRDISVAPIDCSDQVQIIRMMDEEDGVVNRRKKNRSKKGEPRLTLEGESTDDLE